MAGWFGTVYTFFGRELNEAVTVAAENARAKSRTMDRSEDLTATLQFLVQELYRAKPLRLSPGHGGTCFVFTDGAFEPTSETKGSVGDLLVDRLGR